MFGTTTEDQVGVADTHPGPDLPVDGALCDPLNVEAVRVAGMVEAAQSRCEGMLFTATPTQDLDAVITCQHLANQAFALMLRTLTALTNRAGSDEREGVPDEIALALNVSSGTGWSLQHLAVQACELPGLVEAVEADLLSDRHLRAIVRTVCDPELDRVVGTQLDDSKVFPQFVSGPLVPPGRMSPAPREPFAPRRSASCDCHLLMFSHLQGSDIDLEPDPVAH